jgi:hypothetical protein
MPGYYRGTTAQAQTSWSDQNDFTHDEVLTDAPTWISSAQTIQTNYKGGSDLNPGVGALTALDAVWTVCKQRTWERLYDWWTSASVNVPPHLLKDFGEAMQWLRDYLSDDGKFAGGSVDKYVTSRDWTRASEAHPTGTKVYSTYTDRRGFARQNGHAETILIRVVSSGADLVKKVQITGAPRGREPFEYLGSGGMIEISLFDVKNTRGGGNSQAIDNPCLIPDDQTDGAAVASISGWTLPATVAWLAETTTADLFGRQASVLKSSGTTVANHTLTQAITKGLSTKNPYLAGFWARNSGSFDGAMQIDWGDNSQSWVEGDFDSTNWTAFVIDRDGDMWIQRFDEDELNVVISLPTINSGAMELGSAFLIEMKELPETGRHWAALTNDTGPLAEAFQTVADTIGGSEGDHSEVLAKTWDTYLPATGSNLIAEP